MYKKSPENFSLAGSSSNTPFQVFLSARGPKIAQPWRKWVRIKTLTIYMVPTSSDESKLRTFQGPSQDQISGYKDFYGEFHNADI